ncbi:hypothetical protein BFT35_05755 [Thermoanaerobacterium thermosaccharolyticum]|uniref:Uncharacterized protein n=2 Tax=Thermoanaerobacterium thermosaccharolyticum TaxID=1517 RepID=L0IJ82_THETR|nr:hypothetical protein [Thermoanaerobacterium thermosaccharolyticum]AGB18052.1 hypothetical protein Thethe_00324 [Thermoanaerobacterium thermosaccharolyticum M0795]AST57816.1 hypothetical protein Thert_01833 [Thermoanaerobacterium thermosaccharolyticum]PHO07423.1 hypothetical protein BFT35_05755 [Thermoanaerobacterium thermosaccharolyticum]TCW42487.1 hypothetical protein EDC21_101100 [Thermohydrogenium kirishiense]
MLNALGITIIFLIIIFMEVPGLIKKKKTKEIVVFFILIAIGYTLNLLVAFDIKVTATNKIIEMLLKPVEKIWGK